MSRLWLVLYQVLATVALLVAAPYLLWRAWVHPQEMRERLAWGGGRSSGWEPRAQGPGGSAPSIGGTAPLSGGPAPASDRTTPGSDGATAISRESARDAARPLWLHAASLGELESLRALWETPLRAPTGPLLITVLSVSARRRAEAIAPNGASVRFAPLDVWFAVLPFLRRERPRALILVETELWPLTLALCHLGGIPVALVSGRLSARRWRRTRLLAPLLRPLLRRLAGCAVQSADDAERFRFLGASSLEVTGNLKYRLADGPAPRPLGDGRFVFVAGSVRLGEEDVIEASRVPGVLCVLAPRHLREREHWVGACEARGVRWVARSGVEIEVPSASGPWAAGSATSLRERLDRALRANEAGDRPVLLVDRHGELASWYAAADAAFVGGTLVPIGGHNLFEPARCGVPVAFGPHTGGVEDAVEPLLRLGGGARVRNGVELADWVTRLRTDAAAAARGSAGAAAAARALAQGAGRTLDFLGRFPWFGAPSVSGAPAPRTAARSHGALPVEGSPRPDETRR